MLYLKQMVKYITKDQWPIYFYQKCFKEICWSILSNRYNCYICVYLLRFEYQCEDVDRYNDWKNTSYQFVVLYNNVNIYDYAYNQKIYNQSALLNYIKGYICFIKIYGDIDNSDNKLIKQYTNYDQIDRKFVNELSFDEIKFDKDNDYYQSIVVRYTISEVLNRFFFIAINKQIHGHNRSLYTKWMLSLLDFKCKNKSSDILLLPILLYYERNILRIIDILFNIADRLEFSNNIVMNMIIIPKENIMTIKNYGCGIY